MRCCIPALALLTLAAQEPRLTVSTTLVQIDAVVTDRRGRQVVDLTRDDFELFEDGEPRAIRFFSYERSDRGPGFKPAIQPSGSVPGRGLRREEVGRTVAILVDDLRISFQNMHFTREALKKFIDSQVGPGDLVAILKTSGGSSALQPFTTDRTMLRGSVNRLRFYVSGHPESPGLGDGDAGLLGLTLSRRFAVGTMSAVRIVAEGMRDLPGRKSIVLFTEGFSVTSRGKKVSPLLPAEVRTVARDARDGGITIYGVDVRGLDCNCLKAADDAQNLELEQVREALAARSEKFKDTQDGLTLMARESGGFAILNNNDLNEGLSRVLMDQSGYYLLGFQPAEGDGAQRKDLRLTLRLKRSDLQVRYRRSYQGMARVEVQPVSMAGRLSAALRTPFAEQGVRLRLTTSFGLNEGNQPMVQALIHIEGADVSFGTPDENGRLTAKVHVVAYTEGESLSQGARTEQTYTLQVHQDALERQRHGGFVQMLTHPVKKPGAYRLRVAVMDQESGKVGSSSQFIEIPDLSKGALATSSVLMSDGDWRTAGGASDAATGISAAVRKFERGRPFSYGLLVFNVRPGLELHPRMIRDRDVVWEGKPIPVLANAGPAARQTPAGGVLTLGQNTVPGEYLLEIRIVDKAGRSVPVPQLIDFEVR